MPRINIVKKAQKDQGKCIGCQHDIIAGESYKWAKPRYRGKIVACPNCAIPITALSSSKMIPVWEAQDTVGKAEGADDVAQAVRDLAEAAREVAESYQEGIDNEREIFPDNDFSEREEKIEGLNNWAGELEAAADEAEGAYEGGKEDAEADNEDNDEDLDNADIEDAGLDAENEKVQEAKQLAEDCPV